MAAKVLILSETQKISDRPAEKMKRSAADSLVRRLLAVQISKYLYQRIIPAVASNCRQFQPIAAKSYIPDKMPSHKAHGTKVSGPLVEKSRAGIFRIMQANDLARMSSER